MEKIVDFLKERKDFISYQRFAFCPDEQFFHSIIQYLGTKEKITIKPSLTYVNWDIALGNSSPDIFNIADFDRIMEIPASKLFARKFDLAENQGIMDKLDKNNSPR